MFNAPVTAPTGYSFLLISDISRSDTKENVLNENFLTRTLLPTWTRKVTFSPPSVTVESIILVISGAVLTAPRFVDR